MKIQSVAHRNSSSRTAPSKILFTISDLRAPPKNSSKKEKRILLGSALYEQAAGLVSFCIRSGAAEFSPHLPSAAPSLACPSVALAKAGAGEFFGGLCLFVPI